MKSIISTLCLIISIACGSFSLCWSDDFQKGMEAYKKGDFANAIKEWILLAENGDEKAQYFLGLIYYKGKGVPQDYKTALKWFNLSAEQGNALAQYNLGRLYYLGNGVKENMVYAHMWVNLASLNGFEMVEKINELLIEIMTPSQIQEAQKLAIECVKKNYKGC